MLSLLMESDAEQVQGVGVVGLGAEDVAVPPDGLGQQSALVFLQAERKLLVHGDALSMSHAAQSGRWCESDGGFASPTSRCANNGRL